VSYIPAIIKASKVRCDPGHHPGPLHAMRLVTRPRPGERLPLAWRPHVSNDLLSVRALTPVTRFSMRLSTRAGRPRGGDPIYTTACWAGPEFPRVPSPAPRPRR